MMPSWWWKSVEHRPVRKGFFAREGHARRPMGQIQGTRWSVYRHVVLSAVLSRWRFGGFLTPIYRQFSITIVSVVLSVLVAR